MPFQLEYYSHFNRDFNSTITNNYNFVIHLKYITKTEEVPKLKQFF